MSKGRGVGFFEAGNFHPDFIIWLLVDGQAVHLVSSIRKASAIWVSRTRRFSSFETIKDIETRLGDPSVTLNSFIISNTPSHVMKLQWAIDKADMEARHILFQDEDKDTYIEELLGKSLAT